MGGLLKRFDNTLLFFVIYALVYIIFFGTLGYTLPFVLSLLFALILQRPTRYLVKRFKIKNSLASLLITILFFSIVLTLFTLGITILTNEIVQLTKNISNSLSSNNSYISQLINIVQNYYNNLDPSIANAVKLNVSDYMSNTLKATVTTTGKILAVIISFISAIPNLVMVILFTLLSTYFFTKDLSSAKNRFRNMIPKENSDKIFSILNEAKKMFSNYILSYLTLILITFIQTIIGFSVFRVKYAVLLSIVAGILDLVPILGVVLVYIPVALAYFLAHSYFTAIAVSVLYVIVFVVRQVLEPKIVSSSLGIHPVAVLAALFIGIKAAGISGMMFCIFLVVFYNILRKVNVI